MDEIDFSALPDGLAGDLRSDHAGETGAVWIYRGILCVTRDPRVRAFATAHLATEQRHLAFFETQLPAAMRTRARFLWCMAGWLTGALPALFGARAVFVTIAAVETFVDRHYAAQIALLDAPEHRPLRAKLLEFQQDERAHRDEASIRSRGTRGVLGRGWSKLVGAGSAAGVTLARVL